jgi:hypothetical protein
MPKQLSKSASEGGLGPGTRSLHFSGRTNVTAQR